MIAGGEPIFPEFLHSRKAKERVATSEQVIERDPDVIIASWCGMKVDKDEICARPGWDRIAAVSAGHWMRFLHRRSSSLVLPA